MQENVSNHNYNPQDPDIVQRVNHCYNENACNHNVPKKRALNQEFNHPKSHTATKDFI